MDKPTQAQPNLNFQEPPEVTVIEASCKQAHQKSSDFSSFTTVLKNPIIINKGDEIRAVASYIDCPGIDSEIIQFTRSGGEQDNTHTMLTQMYTVNDGFQQKTTSYDYMTNKVAFSTFKAGGGANTPPILIPSSQPAGEKLEVRTFDENGNAMGRGAFISGWPVRQGALTSVTVVKGGYNWSDGDELTWPVQNSTTTARIFTDGNGAIKSVLVTDPGSDVPANGAQVVVKSQNTNYHGEVLIYNVTPITGGGAANNVLNVNSESPVFPFKTGYHPNGQYLPGQLGHIYMTQSGDGTSNDGVDTGCRAYINCVYQGNPSQSRTDIALNLRSGYFDQGYNYQRTPLQRWCQTYENTNLFCYGRNFERKYLANDNIEYNLPDISGINKKDSCLSASIITRRKEDEFVPGYFHNEYSDSTSDFQNKRCAIELTGSNCDFTIGRENEIGLDPDVNVAQYANTGRLLIHPVKKKEYFNSNESFIEKNQIEIDLFATSFLLPGMVVSFKFELVNDTDKNSANELLCHNEFQANWGGIFPIGSNSMVKSSTHTDIMQHYIGPPAMFDDSLSTGIYTKENLSNGDPKSLIICQGNPDQNTGLTDGNGRTALFKFIQSPLASRTVGGSMVSWYDPNVYIDSYIVLMFNISGTIGNVGFIDNREVYFQPDNLPLVKGWKVGDVLQPVLAGESIGIFPLVPRMAANMAPLRILITATDTAGGADFGSFDQLTQDGMVTTNNLPVKLIITPMPFYMSGLQTFNQPDPTGPNSGAREVNPNGYGVQRTATYPVVDSGTAYPISSGNQTFDNYGTNFPPNYSTCFKLDAALTANTDGNVSIDANCILYKPGGIDKTEQMGTKNNKYSYHDSTQTLKIVNNQMAAVNGTKTAVFTIGPNVGIEPNSNHIIHPDTTLAGGLYPIRSLSFNLPCIIRDNPDTVFSFNDLPIHGLVILNESSANERHLMMDGTVTQGTGANINIYTITCNSACVPQSISYNYTLPDMANVDNSYKTVASLGPAVGFANIDTDVHVQWITKPSIMNDNFTARFTNKEGGGIAYTSAQNFFGNTDINLNSNSLLKSSSWQYIKSPVFNIDNNVSSYNKGGVYLLTQNIGSVVGDNIHTPYLDFFGFAQGFSEFILYDGYTNFTPSENQVDAVYNNKLPMVSNQFLPTPYTAHALANNITNIYGYEPLYNQKSFLIDRNFVVPSDIASKWDSQSHLQQGLIDRDTGEQLLEPEETGLVQNEFVHPVYGSNNFMPSNGEYLKDLLLHPNSGGLMGGHCIGVGFIDKKQAWLNPNLYPYFSDWVGRVSPTMVLTATDEIKHYKVYFRTAFTRVRNYDPLKQTTSYLYNYFDLPINDQNPVAPGDTPTCVPDRTPLHTLQTKATNIGNTSRIGSGAQPSPNPDIPALEKKLIDGTVMSWVEDPSQVQEPNTGTATGCKQYDPNVVPNSTIISELMARNDIPNRVEPTPRTANDPKGSPAASDGTSTSFPPFAFAYPFRYVENNSDFEFDRALVSQFAGSSNMTLAFQADVSSFTFQFFYQPYTSPFVDGNGGDLATRIFYGNRKAGIYNHDSLGGNVTWNWARPNYPRGTFSLSEINSFTDNNIYPNGIDPFKSVAVIGKRFLNKLGFQDTDLDIVNNSVDTVNPTHTGFLHTIYTKDVVQEAPPVALNAPPILPTLKTYKSLAISFKGTNFSLIDSSDAILSAIDAPENSASLNKNNTVIPASTHHSSFIKQLNGDYIFYPYSLNGSTDSFQSQSGSVRYDNCTDAYGSVGGMRLSNVARGMGTPNTQGSTSICDQTSIPVTLNVDCNLYLSYSASTANSTTISASTLPKKINHGHLIVLSSLIEEPNFIMAKAGAINGISLISKAFLTGDFILSNGMLSWYAKKKRMISSITTTIVNTAFESPTVLGDNTTVIYSITNNQPKPMDRPTTTYEIQQNDYQTMQMMQQHLASVSNNSIQSPLTQLETMLDQLGIGIVESGDNNKSANLVSELRNQINAFGLNKLSPSQRSEFFKTPAGTAFIQNAGAMRNVMSNMKNINETQQNIDDGLGDSELLAQHNKNIRNTITALHREGTAARARLADTPFVIPRDPMTEPQLEQQPPIPDAHPFDVVRRIDAQAKDPKAQFTIAGRLAKLPGTNKPLIIPTPILVPSDISSVGAESGIVEPNLQPVKPDPSDSGYALSAKQSTAAPSYKSEAPSYKSKAPSYKGPEGGATKDENKKFKK